MGELKWWIVRPGRRPRATLFLGWALGWVILFEALSPFWGPAAAAVYGLVISEACAAATMFILLALSRRKAHVAYTVERALLAPSYTRFAFRAGVVAADLVDYLTWHVWEGEAFLLGTLQGTSVPADERPTTLSQVESVIMSDLADKASTDVPPWAKVESVLKRYSSALQDPQPSRALRDALRDEYLGAFDGYRRYAVSHHPSPLPQSLEAHPWVVEVLIAISTVLSIVLAAIQLLTGHL